MCGICGFLAPAHEPDGDRGLQGMVAQLRHRGPDDSGIWADPGAGLGLGHTRLAILDLSPAGHQPMVSADGRWVVSYNGEIYNAAELAQELRTRGRALRGHSDTEVLLEGTAAWGLERMLGRANGMFALAAWDRSERKLTLARDRLGKKPLYYWRSEGSLLFASELKALRAHPSFRADVDRDALAQFLRFGWLPGPRTIYRGVAKLPPGTSLTVRADDDGGTQPRAYWSALEAAQQLATAPFTGSFDEATAELETLLADAVTQRLAADVPLGALLSGGVDSSLVVAMMQRFAATPVQTFTIGFRERKWDEAPAARAVADHLGTAHTEHYVSANDALEVVPDLPRIYDEPFADPSELPTILVSRLARSAVTVALSGDGADETFGGYGRYRRVLKRWDGLRRWPQLSRDALAGIRDLLPATGGLVRRLQGIEATGAVELYALERGRWPRPAELVRGAEATPDTMDRPATWPVDVPPAQIMMYLDLAGYLPDNGLVKIDRASMAVGLELRAPLLDYRVVEFAMRLPLAHRIGADGGKLLLRRLLERFVPPALVDRPKQGFTPPLAHWLRGPLRGWAEELISEKRLNGTGMLNTELVRGLWRQHQDGRRGHSQLLWHILMFQAWDEVWGATSGT
jgi:asparagine synthase (glutamine-hydrolysing)